MFILTAGVVLIWPSCTQDHFNECLGGRGTTGTERRGLYPFGNVSVHNNISLQIIQGQRYQATITTGENIIPSVTTLIKNNTLFIRNQSVCLMLTDPWDKVLVELTIPDFDTLFLSTAGEVNIAEAFQTDEAWVRIDESSGDINLIFDIFRLHVNYESGTSTVWINGTGHDGFFYTLAYGVLDTRGFHPEHTIINNSSTNNCYVSSGTRILDAKITNLGDIYYQGEPENLIEVIEGPGRLIRLEP